MEYKKKGSNKSQNDGNEQVQSINLFDLFKVLSQDLTNAKSLDECQKVLEHSTITYFRNHDKTQVALIFLGELVVPAYYKWLGYHMETYANNPVGEFNLNAKVYFDDARIMSVVVNDDEIEKLFNLLREQLNKENADAETMQSFDEYYATFKGYQKALEDAFANYDQQTNQQPTASEQPTKTDKKSVTNKSADIDKPTGKTKAPKGVGRTKTPKVKNSMFGGLVALNIWFVILFVAMLALGGGLLYVNHLYATDAQFASEFLPLINEFLNTIASVEYTAAELPAKIMESAISAFVSAGCLAVAAVIIELLKSKIDVADGLGVVLFGVVLLLTSFAKLPISTIICAVIFNKIAKNNLGLSRFARIMLAIALPIAVMYASLIVFPI